MTLIQPLIHLLRVTGEKDPGADGMQAGFNAYNGSAKIT